MENLYQDIILDHNRRPRNYGLPDNPTHRAEARNTLCGDEMEVVLEVQGERIREICFRGQGCAISKASASLMTEALTGLSVDEARAHTGRVIDGLENGSEETGLFLTGELAALSGVRRFPARIKCALLAWKALLAALEDGQSVKI